MPEFKGREYVLFFFLRWNWLREVLDKKFAEWKMACSGLPRTMDEQLAFCILSRGHVSPLFDPKRSLGKKKKVSTSVFHSSHYSDLSWRERKTSKKLFIIRMEGIFSGWEITL